MKKDIFVLGSSAGGIDALRRLVRNLPADINAALFVVQHVPSWHRSELPEILRAIVACMPCTPRAASVSSGGTYTLLLPTAIFCLKTGK